MKFLEAAPDDFGHRADAVQACCAAIAHFRLALTFREKEHKSGEKR